MQQSMSRRAGVVVGVGLAVCVLVSALPAAQPPVTPGPNEPNWSDLLRQQWGLDMQRDLRNPVMDGVEPPGVFRRVNPKKPVVFRPVIALGLETTTRGGWYPAGPRATQVGTHWLNQRHDLWAYAYKQPTAEPSSGEFTPPPLRSGEVSFDPGEQTFGFWVGNDEFQDGAVFTQPERTRLVNERLSAQPYKAMIYPARDAKTGKLVPNSYVIGWEYSTNDDFQDVVTLVENVRLLPAEPALKGVLVPGVGVQKVAGGFGFVEGPAWDSREHALYFSDIPRSQILRYADGEAKVVQEDSGQSNGLMFDRKGNLVACEGGTRRISRGRCGAGFDELTSRCDGKRLNSPNDLWLDAADGVYFTDPRYGKADDLEQDAEGVYYLAADGTTARLVSNLVKPNGIALSPDGQRLYVADWGADSLVCYPVEAPGRIGAGERIAYVRGPDGMTVDVEGRLYVTTGDGVCVLNADGRWLGVIEVPESPANCTFGGSNQRTLFITARTSLYSIATQTKGWHHHLDGVPGVLDSPRAGLREARKKAARRRRRIIMNNDGNDMNKPGLKPWVASADDPATAEDFLSKRTSPLAGSHVDAIYYCTGVFNLHTHESTVAEQLGDERSPRWAWAPELIKQGTDNLKIMIGFGHQNNMEVFWSMRMNDTHDSSKQSEDLFCQWKRDHPMFLFKHVYDQFKYAGRRWSAVNYAMPEVREKVFRLFEDVCLRYDVDGVELDFFRHPVYFTPQAVGEPVTPAQCDLMTGLVQRIREMAEAIGVVRGRPILVSIRVPDSSGYAKAIGLDVERWLAADLVDIVAGGGYFRLEPWESLVKMGRKYDVPVYAVLSGSRLVDPSLPEGQGDPALWRGAALKAWEAGVDGIYTFNRFRPLDPVFRELGDPELLRTLEHRYERIVGKPVEHWLKGGRRFVVEER